jgi:hypothetical protein
MLLYVGHKSDPAAEPNGADRQIEELCWESRQLPELIFYRTRKLTVPNPLTLVTAPAKLPAGRAIELDVTMTTVQDTF